MENHSIIQGVYLVGGLRFHRDSSSFLEAIEHAFIGGIRLFQLRIKDELTDKEHLNLARQVRSLTRQYGVTYLINDRPDIAKLCDADGVHVGPDDLPASEIRKIIGNKIIGRSSHSWKQAEIALQESISYLSVGPVYGTDCKKVSDAMVGTALVSEVMKQTNLPIVAIGGITTKNMGPVREIGVNCVGVIRDIMGSSDLCKASRNYIGAFNISGEKK
ncbi:thiamine phosphate synthase [bacterium]|nr:thiamine phosphate synthase [bacterium]